MNIEQRESKNYKEFVTLRDNLLNLGKYDLVLNLVSLYHEADRIKKDILNK